MEQDPALAAALDRLSDFDLTRRDPVEDVVLPTGMPLEPIAGCGAGGTYFLCGEAGSAPRPVLYADSEGQATLLGADLVEAVTVLVVLPFWHDLAAGFPIGEAGEELRADQPDFEAERDRLLLALGLPPATEEEAAALLRAAAARTAPDYVPRVPDDEHLPYGLLFALDTP